MVQIDAGDDGAVGIDDVRGVKPPAHAHLQNDHVQLGEAQQAQDRQGGEFEIGQRNLVTALHARLLHGGKLLHQLGGGDDLAIHPAALFEVHQMRRGEHARLVTRLQRHGFQHRAGGTLAIGAGHGDHGAVEMQVQPLGHLAHALKAHFDVVGMQAFAIAQPAVQSVR
ncbi:hypothetical protein SDC9_194195 [bioreactor metagenome]|uniref:Uncharacterized protein n=1 Tax=bioreactor metagenome TaxID=1076179 RepID=A0A645IE84_9ZZZZ